MQRSNFSSWSMALGLFSLVLFLWQFSAFQTDFKRSEWPHYDAIAAGVRITEGPCSGSSESPRVCQQTNVSLRYAHAGKTFTYQLKREWATKEEAEAYGKRFPRGEPVPVWLNPEALAVPLLRRPPLGLSLAWAGMFLLIGVALFVRGFIASAPEEASE